MKEKRAVICSRAISFMMAVAMLFSIITVCPKEVSAAEYSFNGTGTSEITITDDACRQATKNKEFHWIRVTPKKTGSITITTTNASSVVKDTYGNIVLCNASKKVIDNTVDRYETAGNTARRTVAYGVRANTTYYFRVESSGGVKIKATLTTIKKKSGTSRKKAKTLAHNKTVKGVIVAEDKTVDWYKINLKKTDKMITITSTVNTNGWNGTNVADGIQFEFCGSDGKMFKDNAYKVLTRDRIKHTMTFWLGNKGSKKKYGLKPGTYYIKVQRSNKASSGEYTVKWKMSDV